MTSEDIAPAVGQQLKKRREDLDLTQQEAAKRIDITSTTVSSTERGLTRISRGKRGEWERAYLLKQGTISRAYAEGTPLEPLPGGPEEPYADLSDPHERAISEWPGMSEQDKRAMIGILRQVRQEERRRA